LDFIKSENMCFKGHNSVITFIKPIKTGKGQFSQEDTKMDTCLKRKGDGKKKKKEMGRKKENFLGC